MRFFIIDDSQTIVMALAHILRGEGHEVQATTAPQEAMDAVLAFRPDVILLDLMMPGIDGYELCIRFRRLKELDRTRILILTGKSYDFDKRRARAVGADAFLVKQTLISDQEAFLRKVMSAIRKEITLAYWGTRGTLPMPGEKSLRYGGNTPCISLSVDDEPLLVFDAGTGITRLAAHLCAQTAPRITAKLFVTHPHWDHINAIPFFTPLYLQGSEVEIIGPAHGNKGFREIVAAQMDDIYFPITMREFAAGVHFRDMREETLSFGDFEVRGMLLNHPGTCLGYRISHNGRIVCYVTDNESRPAGDPLYNPEYEERLVQFVQDADILITDCTYLDEEYPARRGWGHSCTREVARLASEGGVRSLHLFHHDYVQDDATVDRKLVQAIGHLERLGGVVECVCPAEGSRYVLGADRNP